MNNSDSTPQQNDEATTQKSKIVVVKKPARKVSKGCLDTACPEPFLSHFHCRICYKLCTVHCVLQNLLHRTFIPLRIAACSNCRKSHAKCDPVQRPCPRCIRLELTCVDVPGKKRGRKKKKRGLMSSDDEGLGLSSHFDDSSSMPPTKKKCCSSSEERTQSDQGTLSPATIHTCSVSSVGVEGPSSSLSHLPFNFADSSSVDAPSQFHTTPFNPSTTGPSASHTSHPTYSLRELNNLFNMNPGDTWFIKESTYRDLNHQGVHEDDVNQFTDILNENMTDEDSEFLPSLANSTAWQPSGAQQSGQAFGYDASFSDGTTPLLSNPQFNNGTALPFLPQLVQMQQQWMQQQLQQNVQVFPSTTTAPNNEYGQTGEGQSSMSTTDSTNATTFPTTPSSSNSSHPSTITDLHSIDIGEDVRNIVKSSNEVCQIAAGRSCSRYLLHGVPKALRTDLITLKSHDKYQEVSAAGRDAHARAESGEQAQHIDRSNDHEFLALTQEVAHLRKRDQRRQNEIQILSAMNESLRLQLMNLLSRRSYKIEDDTTEIRLPKADVSEEHESNDMFSMTENSSKDTNISGEGDATMTPPVSSESHLTRPDASKIDSLSKSFTELLSLFNSKEEMDSHRMGILVCFPGGRITTCNKTLLDKIGYSASSLYDELNRWEDVISERYWGNVIHFLAETLKTVSHKRAFHLEECAVKHRDGTIIPCESIVTIIGGNQSQIPVFVCSYFIFKESGVESQRELPPGGVDLQDIIPCGDLPGWERYGK